MYEGRCINPACSANGVWVLDPDNTACCATCLTALSDYATAPEQKVADPDRVPDIANIHKGA